MIPALIVPSVRPVGVAAATPQTAFVGNSIQIVYRQFLIGGGSVDHTSDATWSTSSSAIATVDTNGVVTFVSAGTVSITGTLNGVSTTVTYQVTQGQDGSLADFRNIIGDANIVSLWDFSTNVTTDGAGHVTQVDDARGISFGPSLIGNGGTKPSYNAGAGTITTDGSQNYMATAQDARYALQQDRTRVIVYWGSAPSSGQFAAFIAATGPAKYMGLDQSGGFIDMAVNPGASPANLEGTAPAAAYCEAATSSMRTWIIEEHAREGTTGTLGNNAAGYQAPGRVRHIDLNNGPASATADATSAFGIGAVPGGPQRCATLSGGAAILSIVPTPAMRQAIQRRGVARGAVLSAAPKNGILCFGDSITRGSIGASDFAHTFPAQLQALPSIRGGYEVANRGVASRTVAEVVAASGLFSRQLLVDRDPTQRVTDWAVIWLGTNDNDGSHASTIIANNQTLCDQALAAGFRVLVLTMIKRSSFGSSQETDRQTINAAILNFATGGHATKVYDVASETHFQNTADTTYYFDGTHLTDTGYGIVAAGVAAAIIAAGG